MNEATQPRRRGRAVAVILLVLGSLAVGVVAAVIAGGGSPRDLPVVGARDEPERDEAEGVDPVRFEPFRWDPEREQEFLERGRDGLAHILFALSPGGVEATAARVDRYRDEIEEAAERHDVSADTLEALVFLESAGRPEVVAGGDPAGAVGLAQILPGTATDLLGMSVDLARSSQLTRRVELDRRRSRRARTARRRRAAARRVPRLEAARRRVDDRFRVEPSLDGAGRYLALAEDRFGREDLATTSYHMGIGNLEDVVETYVSPRRPRDSTRETVAAYDVSYPAIYFDSSPLRNPRTYRRLTRFDDDSRHYLFRLEAARQAMELWREDREDLRRLAEQHARKASAEEVLRPRDDTPAFEDGDALRDAYDDEDLIPLPNDPRRLGFRVDSKMGALARRVKEQPRLYRGLRPEALATLLYVAKEVPRIAGRKRALLVTSTVRDLPYQRALVGVNAQATRQFSLHTTGYAFDILRSRRYERPLVQVLERLRALRVVDWVYEPAAIHVTVGPDGEEFLPLNDALLERRGG